MVNVPLYHTFENYRGRLMTSCRHHREDIAVPIIVDTSVAPVKDDKSK